MKISFILFTAFFLGLVIADCNPPCVSPNCCSKWGFCGQGDAYCGSGGSTGGSSTTGSGSSSSGSSSSGGSSSGGSSTGGGGSNVPAPVIKGPKYVVYIDAAASWWGDGLAASLNVPGYAKKNSYNVICLAFWLSGSAADMAGAWASLDDATKSKYLDAYHNAGMRVIASAFGATEFPTSAGADPVSTASKFASFIKTNRLDGGDVDYEDSAAFTASKGADWLIKFTNTLRDALPSPQYIITHAPQGPYFTPGQYPDGAYLKIHKEVGDKIDFYNVQFYNQATTTYENCQTLLHRADGWATNSSLFELIGMGFPQEKIIIGKPIARADVYNTGFMDASAIAACGKEAHSKGWNGGFMGWQFSHDLDGSWIGALAASLQ